MRGKDDTTGEFLSPSRSEQRRGALEIFELGEKLVGLTAAQLAKLPISDDLLSHIEDTQRIPSNIARKRQLQFLAKQMRREDDETLDAIRDALDAGGDASRRETAQVHQVEAWRERLLADGDAALTDLLAAHPTSDRQQLRQMVRNANEEKLKNKPLHAYRELFRVLRELLGETGTGDREPEAGSQDI